MEIEFYTQHNGDEYEIKLPETNERFYRYFSDSNCCLPYIMDSLSVQSDVRGEVTPEHKASHNAAGRGVYHSDSDFRTFWVGTVSQRGIALLRAGAALHRAGVEADQSGNYQEYRDALGVFVELGAVPADGVDYFVNLAQRCHRDARKLAFRNASACLTNLRNQALRCGYDEEAARLEEERAALEASNEPAEWAAIEDAALARAPWRKRRTGAGV